MELLFIYFWLKLDRFITFSWALWIFVGVFWLFLWLWILSCEKRGPFGADKENIKQSLLQTKKLRLVLSFVFLFGLFSSLLMPTSKETAILVASHYAMEFSKSPEGVKVWAIARKTANNILDQVNKEVSK